MDRLPAWDPAGPPLPTETNILRGRSLPLAEWTPLVKKTRASSWFCSIKAPVQNS